MLGVLLDGGQVFRQALNVAFIDVGQLIPG
jgi:hypothetical protein